MKLTASKAICSIESSLLFSSQLIDSKTSEKIKVGWIAMININDFKRLLCSIINKEVIPTNTKIK
jgi:hypothetical protein